MTTSLSIFKSVPTVVLGLAAGCAGIEPPRLAIDGEPVTVCLGGQCGLASERFSKDQILGGLLRGLRNNQGTTATFCEADVTGTCLADHVRMPVKGGMVVDDSTVSAPKIKSVGFDSASRQVAFLLAFCIDWGGDPLTCDDAYTANGISDAFEVSIGNPGFHLRLRQF